MKAKLLLAILCIVTSVFTTQAQLVTIHSFDGTHGSDSQGALINVGGYLYGMTFLGGAHNDGVIFKIMPDGSGYTDIFDFNDTASGTGPTGSLIYDGNYLYGMTTYGGVNEYGVVFKIKPDGTGYVKLLDLNIANGASPSGSLLSDGTYLYGMTELGGANGGGKIFKIKTDGTAYAGLHDFAAPPDGRQPFGSLISDGTFLYGTTSYGGTLDSGTIFKIKPDGTAYATVFNFSSTNGSYSHGDLLYDGTYFYAMTTNGGAHNLGVVYKIRPDGSGYTKLLDFAGANGQHPFWGSLIFSGGLLYGLTAEGGSNNDGVLFTIKTDGTGYSDLVNFSATTGQNPQGSLYSDLTHLYGTTIYDPSANGTIFKFGLETGIAENELQSAIIVYPNPGTGIFNVNVDQTENRKITRLKIYNALSQCVYQLNTMQTATTLNFPVDLSAAPNGIYLINVETTEGTFTKKVMIQK